MTRNIIIQYLVCVSYVDRVFFQVRWFVFASAAKSINIDGARLHSRSCISGFINLIILQKRFTTQLIGNFTVIYFTILHSELQTHIAWTWMWYKESSFSFVQSCYNCSGRMCLNTFSSSNTFIGPLYVSRSNQPYKHVTFMYLEFVQLPYEWGYTVLCYLVSCTLFAKGLN